MVQETTSANSEGDSKLLFSVQCSVFRGGAELETGGKRYANKRGLRQFAGDTTANL
jgi:hypothetical protein